MANAAIPPGYNGKTVQVYNGQTGGYETVPDPTQEAAFNANNATDTTRNVEAGEGYVLGPNGYQPTAATARKQQIQDIGNSQEQTLFGTLNKAIGGLTSSLSMANSGLPTGGVSTPAQVSYVSVPSQQTDYGATAAENAAYGAAKAKAGAAGTASMNTLRASLADRGLLGGGTEARGLVDRLAGATNPLSDLNVAQLGENTQIAQHNQDLASQQAGNQFQGAVTERGQNIQASEANAQLAQQAALAKQQLLMSVLSGLTGRLNVGLSY